GRIDTEAGNAALNEVLQQIAVIATDLDDPGTCAKGKACDGFFDEAARMRKPAVRERREIDIFSVEVRLRRLETLKLHQPAAIADKAPERIESLAERRMIGANERI